MLFEPPDIGLAGDGNRAGEAFKTLRVHAGDEKVLRADPTGSPLPGRASFYAFSTRVPEILSASPRPSLSNATARKSRPAVAT